MAQDRLRADMRDTADKLDRLAHGYALASDRWLAFRHRAEAQKLRASANGLGGLAVAVAKAKAGNGFDMGGARG